MGGVVRDRWGHRVQAGTSPLSLVAEHARSDPEVLRARPGQNCPGWVGESARVRHCRPENQNLSPFSPLGFP